VNAQQALEFRTPGRGTWKGLYLWEHRHAPHARSVILAVMGER
jgi:thiamine phosphate synthase YjbQ (UPF0047 family)